MSTARVLPVWTERLQAAARAVATDRTDVLYRAGLLADVRDRAEEFWQRQPVGRQMAPLQEEYFRALRSRLVPDDLPSHAELEAAWAEACGAEEAARAGATAVEAEELERARLPDLDPLIEGAVGDAPAA